MAALKLAPAHFTTRGELIKARIDKRLNLKAACDKSVSDVCNPPSLCRRQAIREDQPRLAALVH